MGEKQLGQYLKKLRASHGYTQEFVASYLNVSRQAYGHYENNRALPGIPGFYRISELYQIPAEPLLEMYRMDEESLPYAEPYPTEDDMHKFWKYINDDKNTEKLKYLSRREKELLYYFSCLTPVDQNEIIEILKIKRKKPE